MINPENRVNFPTRIGFQKTLKARVHNYFQQRGLAGSGDGRLFRKTAIILPLLVASYCYLVFFSSSLVTTLVAAFVMAQCLALVGFNIMHDGAHGSYSNSKIVNWIMGFSLDLIGGSNVLWRQKHNILHHTYTNIDQLDDDLETFGLLRLSPAQNWRPWHRLQHLYAFPVYSLLTLSWVVYSDYKKFFWGRIGAYRLRKIAAGQMVLFFATKLLYLSYALLLPMFFHPLLHVASVFLLVHLILGLTLSVVFQLAHTVEGNTFPQPDAESGNIQNEWAIHEVETTANFAPDNPLATWYLGGLNYQIEHHLFSRVSHVHYPDIAQLVKETCAEFSVRYVCYPTVRAAIAAHVRFLRDLGRSPA